MGKGFFVIILCCALLTPLIGCGAVEPVQVNVSTNTNLHSNQLNNLLKISGDLYYDAATRIVYFKNHNSYGGSYTPYYAPNGLPYRYNPETNTFEEINN